MENPFKSPVITALRAWIEMEAAIKLVEGSTLGNDQKLAERYRQQAHDLLDAHMDGKQSAIVLAVQALKNGKSK